MRILLAGPDHPQGSLPPYLAVLVTELTHLGATVYRLGSTGPPYDVARQRFWHLQHVLDSADALAEQVDPRDFDVVSLHFGNLEVEQLLPDRWRRRYADLPPVVVHIHALAWTLFTQHIPDPPSRAATNAAVADAAGLVYFGTYARTAINRRLPTTVDTLSAVTPLPTTIPTDTVPAVFPALANALQTHRADATVVSLCGYAAPWKSAADLIAALDATTAPLRAILAGPLWDDPEQADIDLRRPIDRPLSLGAAAELVVVPTYLDSAERSALTNASHAGLFPYRPQPTFQGSGAVADYLASGRPVIATDVANMNELAGPAGIITPAGDPAALARSLDRFATDEPERTRLTEAARTRSGQFTTATHAAACLDLYRTVIAA